MSASAAYDEYADWYEAFVQDSWTYMDRVRGLLGDLLGPGTGRCLDLCCGGGAHAATIASRGWTPIGVDLSLGQLRHAQGRLPVAAGDASRLPVRSGSLPAVACVLAHTDLPNYAVVIREAVQSVDVAPTDPVVLRAAVSAYLGRCRGQTRLHTESDLRVFLRWCTDRRLDPLAAVRMDIERYVRWLQDVRRYQPSTVSRRLSVVVGFYRVCVIDQILAHSPADYVRRPTVPAESPTLGLGHLQFEALITTARLVGQPERLRPHRAPRPARTTDLRSLRSHHR
jgi:SAM-dependent methyltransferase